MEHVTHTLLELHILKNTRDVSQPFSNTCKYVFETPYSNDFSKNIFYAGNEQTFPFKYPPWHFIIVLVELQITNKLNKRKRKKHCKKEKCKIF